MFLRRSIELLGYVRGLFFAYRVRRAGGKCGRRLYISPTAVWTHRVHTGIHIGDAVRIGNHVTVEAPIGAIVAIGSGTCLTRYAVLSAVQAVSVGSNCLVAEFVSIRDHDHGMALGIPMIRQPVYSEPITIGDDVWVGRGVAVLRGTRIGNGAVLAANAVVKGRVEENAIVAGMPATQRKLRK